MYHHGRGVARDRAEALRWWLLAAAQGYPEALFEVRFCHHLGRSDVAEAIRWFKRAQAAGYPRAAAALRKYDK